MLLGLYSWNYAKLPVVTYLLECPMDECTTESTKLLSSNLVYYCSPSPSFLGFWKILFFDREAPPKLTGSFSLFIGFDKEDAPLSSCFSILISSRDSSFLRD